MYTQTANRLALNNRAQVSGPVPMAGANAASFDVTIYEVNPAPSTVLFQMQGSNDLENWTAKGALHTKNVEGYFKFPVVADISTKYLRLTYATSAATVLTAGIYTFKE